MKKKLKKNIKKSLHQTFQDSSTTDEEIEKQNKIDRCRRYLILLKDQMHDLYKEKHLMEFNSTIAYYYNRSEILPLNSDTELLVFPERKEEDKNNTFQDNHSSLYN